MSDKLEVRRDGVVLCTYIGEEQFPDKETMKQMKASGCKFYMDGKIYKPEKKTKQKQYKIY